MAMNKRELIKRLEKTNIGFLRDAIRKKAFSSFSVSYYKEELKNLEAKRSRIKKKRRKRG